MAAICHNNEKFLEHIIFKVQVQEVGGSGGCEVTPERSHLPGYITQEIDVSCPPASNDPSPIFTSIVSLFAGIMLPFIQYKLLNVILIQLESGIDSWSLICDVSKM